MESARHSCERITMLRKARWTPPKPEPVACVRCTKPTDEPRRGLCIACYLRQRRGSEFTIDACCQVCSTADKRVLRWHRLAGGFAVLCANHAAIAGRRALELDALRAECA